MIAAAPSLEAAAQATLDAILAATEADVAALHLFTGDASRCRASLQRQGTLHWHDDRLATRGAAETGASERSGAAIRHLVESPVCLQGERIGTLQAGWDRPRAETAVAHRRLHRLAGRLAVAFAGLRRRADLAQVSAVQAITTETMAAILHADDLDQALRALLAGMHHLTGADQGGVRLLHVPGRTAAGCRLLFWRGGADYAWLELEGEPDSNTARVVATDRPDYTPDLAALAAAGDPIAALAHARDGLGSSLIVPIHAQGRIIGTLHADARRPHAFRQEQLQPLQVLADHAGGAVEQARLRAEATERRRRLEIAERVSAAVNAADDLDGMLARVLHEAAILIGAERGAVVLVDADRRYVRGRVGLGLPPGLLEATVRQLYAAPHPAEDVFALVVRTGAQLLIGDDHPALHRHYHRALRPLPRAPRVHADPPRGRGDRRAHSLLDGLPPARRRATRYAAAHRRAGGRRHRPCPAGGSGASATAGARRG